MMVYEITDKSHERALEMGLKIIPSSKKFKKVDCYDLITGEYKFSIGDIRKKDYHEILKEHGIKTALEYKSAYRKKHKYDKKEEQFANHRILN